MLFTETMEGAENMHDSEHLSPFTEEELVRQPPQLSAKETFSPSSNATFDPQDHEDVLEENVNSPTGEQNGMKVPQQNLAAETTTSAVNKVEPFTFEVDDFHTQPVCEPRIGLEFDTKEAAYAFYRDYASSVGFGITIKSSRLSKKSGKFIDVKIVCSRFGSKREPETLLNPRPHSKTDCRAGMHIKRTENGNWMIHNFVKEHNHEICPDDDLRHSLKGSKQESVAFDMQLGLDGEAVEMLLEKLMCLQNENPNFFYSIDLDHEKRVMSVLWIDPNGRQKYDSFCDVVFFDTFYTSNNYNTPLVPIVGVNNNNQYTLFGTALVGSDKVTTYIWVMQTWLKAMGGRSPGVILTDLDNTLKEAVAVVFPETRHCVCLWHVLGMIPKNLGYVIRNHKNFLEKFKSCIYYLLTEEEFEVQWRDLVNKFELGEDEWVQSLYEDRRKWVPVYMQDGFLAGMSTAERSGSITSFFDKYICRETKVEDFIENYKLYLQERYELEAESHTTTTQEKSLLMMQMSALYTDAVIEQFQPEVSRVVHCHMQKESENEEASVRFRVEESGFKNFFTVVRNEEQVKICCSCRSFEYRGFLCRHALLVIQTLGISNIPSHYILKRWTKNAKIRGDIISQEKSTERIRCRKERFNELCKKAMQLGLEASLSQEGHDIAFRALEQVLRQCVGVNNSEPSSFAAIHGSVGAGEKRKMKRRFNDIFET